LSAATSTPSSSRCPRACAVQCNTHAVAWISQQKKKSSEPHAAKCVEVMCTTAVAAIELPHGRVNSLSGDTSPRSTPAASSRPARGPSTRPAKFNRRSPPQTTSFNNACRATRFAKLLRLATPTKVSAFSYQHLCSAFPQMPTLHRCFFCPVRVLSFFPPSLGAHRAWEKKAYLECHLGFIRGEDRHVDDAGHNCRKPTCLSVLCVLFFFAREKLGTGLKRGGIRLRSCEPRDPTARGTHLLQRKNRGGRVVCSLSDTVQYCFPP
jgi:hypothetical protein